MSINLESGVWVGREGKRNPLREGFHFNILCAY